jgi:hypothetical protein
MAAYYWVTEHFLKEMKDNAQIFDDIIKHYASTGFFGKLFDRRMRAMQNYIQNHVRFGLFLDLSISTELLLTVGGRKYEGIYAQSAIQGSSGERRNYLLSEELYIAEGACIHSEEIPGILHALRCVKDERIDMFWRIDLLTAVYELIVFYGKAEDLQSAVVVVWDDYDDS